ncbi:pyruvate formate-lyase-activating protein [Mollicutes bacterium LVI A0078]|nr:pyruvate formate-lyase-activating protein [Mollicutes bacterium LVI A0078]
MKWGTNMKNAYVHSLESFGTVDGPGTRFVVFLKGCNLRCKFCHNPDTWKLDGAKEMSVEEILNEYEKIKEFITGGITITGGEPLLQLDFLIDFAKEAKARGIHMCIDTSGGVYNPQNVRQDARMRELFKYIDLVMLDIKHIDSEGHKNLVGIGNERVLSFAKFLDSIGQEMWIRHVLVPGITMDDKLLFRLGLFIGELKNVIGIEVLPYHTMALVKYENLNYDYPLKGVRAAEKEEAERARQIILLARQEAMKKNQDAE